MIYKVLTYQEVQELIVELKSRLPGTAKIFYVIRSFLHGLLPGKEVIVDQWPKWSSLIVRTSDPEKVQPFFRHTYMCHAKSVTALKYFLQRPDVINWAQPATFTGVPRDVAPLLASLSRKHLGTMSTLDPRFMYAWPTPGLPEMPEIPEGLTLGTLSKKDAITLCRDWEGSRYKEDLEGYFSVVIENFDSSCLRDSKGELLAYVCMQYNGSMAMLYVKPDRDKNYSKIVLTDLARKRLRKGEVAYGFVPVNNAPLINLMREMEFVWVPRGDMVWVHFEPLKINRGAGPSTTQEANYCDHSAQSDTLSSGFCSTDNRTADGNLVFMNGMPLATEHATWVTS